MCLPLSPAGAGLPAPLRQETTSCCQGSLVLPRRSEDPPPRQVAIRRRCRVGDLVGQVVAGVAVQPLHHCQCCSGVRGLRLRLPVLVERVDPSRLTSAVAHSVRQGVVSSKARSSGILSRGGEPPPCPAVSSGDATARWERARQLECESSPCGCGLSSFSVSRLNTLLTSGRGGGGGGLSSLTVAPSLSGHPTQAGS